MNQDGRENVPAESGVVGWRPIPGKSQDEKRDEQGAASSDGGVPPESGVVGWRPIERH